MPNQSDAQADSAALGLPTPFDGNSSNYAAWRSEQLTRQNDPQHVHVLDNDLDSHANQQCLKSMCQEVQDFGFTLYQWREEWQEAGNENVANPRQRELELHQHLGLVDADTGIISGTDNLSLLEDKTGTQTSRFIPYSNRAMNWHTDGYYNDAEQSVRCFSLYCIEQAAHGGALTLMKNELLLIALYDTNPAWVVALTHPQAMLLPANKDEEGHHRPDRAVPIFSVFEDGELNTRFTTRTRNIQWHSETVKEAAAAATQLINDNTRWHTQVRLKENQGIITRNLLHKREAFEDDQSVARRQILRGRYANLPYVRSDNRC